jgi:hypothetical protein
MGCGPVRLQRSFVPVNFEEVVNVLVLLVVKNVEAQAAWLIPLGANGIHLDRLEEPFALLWLDPDLHPQCKHANLPSEHPARAPSGRLPAAT